jgi:D-alanine transaminase
MPELAYLNGTIMPIAEAMVPAEDRGYNFGDAVYEYVASYHGRLFCLEPHLDRLERSMRELHFAPLSRDEVRRAIQELFDRAQIARAGIYIQVSRGVAPRDHAYPPPDTPLQFFMTIRPVREKPPEVREKGASAITVTDLRWGRCRPWKPGSSTRFSFPPKGWCAKAPAPTSSSPRMARWSPIRSTTRSCRASPAR